MGLPDRKPRLQAGPSVRALRAIRFPTAGVQRLVTLSLVFAAQTLVVALAASAAPQVQEKPDFSGRWELSEPAKPSGPEVPGALVVRQPLTRTTVAGKPMEPAYLQITIERYFDARTDSETHTIGLVGGEIHGLPADGIRIRPDSVHAVVWEGGALVFERATYTGGSPRKGTWTERRETWSLDADGRLRIVITSRGSEQPQRSETHVYRRGSAARRVQAQAGRPSPRTDCDNSQPKSSDGGPAPSWTS